MRSTALPGTAVALGGGWMLTRRGWVKNQPLTAIKISKPISRIQRKRLTRVDYNGRSVTGASRFALKTLPLQLTQQQLCCNVAQVISNG